MNWTLDLGPGSKKLRLALVETALAAFTYLKNTKLMYDFAKVINCA